MRKDMDIHGLVARGKLKLAADILAEKEEAKKRYKVQTDSGIIINSGMTLEEAEKLVNEHDNYVMWEEKS